MAGQAKAHELGYSQVLWLDGAQRKYVEEVGSMNCFFVIDGVVRTAPCAGTVLPGITRDSCIKLLRGWDYRVDDETRLAADELMELARAGRLQEVFGTGTAAVISPVGQLYYRGETLTVNRGETGRLTRRLYETLTGIQYGRLADPYGWTHPV